MTADEADPVDAEGEAIDYVSTCTLHVCDQRGACYALSLYVQWNLSYPTAYIFQLVPMCANSHGKQKKANSSAGANAENPKGGCTRLNLTKRRTENLILLWLYPYSYLYNDYTLTVTVTCTYSITLWITTMVPDMDVTTTHLSKSA